MDVFSALQFASTLSLVESLASRRGRSRTTETVASKESRNLKPMGMVGRKATEVVMSRSVRLAVRGRGVMVELGRPRMVLAGRLVRSMWILELVGTWL